MLNSRIRATLVVAFLSAAPLVAQTTELSVATIFGDGEFASDLIEAKWTPDPMYFTVLEENGDLADLYRVDARSGDRQLLLRGTDLVPRGESTPIAIEEYEFSSDGSKLLIFTNSVRVWRSNTKGEYYVWDFNRRRLIAVGEREGLQMFAKFSPDGRYVGFVRDNNIFITEIRNGRERQLTFDGDENIINGTTDWVYEEELGLQDAFRFSPDSRKIAFWRLDQTVIKPFYMIDQLSLYPELMPVRYPKAGEANSEVRIGVVEISSRDATWIDLGEETDIYVPRMDFAGSSDEVWFTRFNRHQNRLDLMLADVRTGESRIVTTETDDAWVENSMPLWIDNGVQFLLESERDGYNQVYRYDRSGTLINRVTPGEWDVLDVYGVDEQHDVLYFSGTGDGRAKRPLYRVSLDGAGFERVSSGSGSHDVDFNVDYSMYVDEYSTIGLPPTKTLHESDGATVRTLSDNQQLISRIQALAAAVPEFIRIPVRGGLELDGYIIRPPDFDVGKLYPVLMYVYGGPGSQRVRDSWGGDRYLWHQSLAQLGYLVVSVDNRGTGARGRDFKKQTYLKLGQYETEDQIAAARYLGSLPFVDNSRIGIWGWSYGGYMSLMSMFQGEGVFKAAISVAPVTDWRLYDTIYTERYMRTPRENPAGYRDGAPLNHAYKLSGDLLVVHGTGDDNVHAQNTIQLIQQLEDAGMQFDMRLYPNKTHSIAGAVTRVNLYSLFTRWLQENL
jgi:dipeptidyl-peptidase-4